MQQEILRNEDSKYKMIIRMESSIGLKELFPVMREVEEKDLDKKELVDKINRLIDLELADKNEYYQKYMRSLQKGQDPS